MAVIPTSPHHLSLLLMVEIDARKYGMREVAIARGDTAWALTKRFGFHFISLVSIIVFLLLGYSPIASVFWATVVAFFVSFLNRDTALLDYRVFVNRPKGWVGDVLLRSKLKKALEAGSVGMLNVAATCAAAGLIVGVVTLTGLGLRFSEIVIAYAGGNLIPTAIYTSLIVWVVGLAVPVTASYIICAVIAAPALMKLGVPDFAAHMFIFYYAVLSEVSPPTALSPFAAAAITGGDPYKTTLQAWKYTLPAFVVPFMFVLDPIGVGLLLSLPKGGGWWDVVWVTLLAVFALIALAGAAEGWLLAKTNGAERLLLLIGGLLLVYPKPLYDALGFGLLIMAVILQLLRPTHGAKRCGRMTLETWLAFLVAAILISVSPGAGAVACMATGMRYGYRLGIWNIFGMQVGIALQLAIVGAGLGAVLAASSLAFTILKWLGVLYLAYLGWRAWNAPAVPVDVDRAAMPPTTPSALFGQGFLVNATNPKATVFFLAVPAAVHRPGARAAAAVPHGRRHAHRGRSGGDERVHAVRREGAAL